MLARKPGACDLTRPIQHGRGRWPPSYEQYLTALRQARPEDATRQFVRILQLHAQFSAEQIAITLTQALALPCWAADGVEQLLRQAHTASPPPAAVNLAEVAGRALLAAVTSPLPDLARYSQLRPEEVAR